MDIDEFEAVNAFLDDALNDNDPRWVMGWRKKSSDLNRRQRYFELCASEQLTVRAYKNGLRLVGETQLCSRTILFLRGV